MILAPRSSLHAGGAGRVAHRLPPPSVVAEEGEHGWGERVVSARCARKGFSNSLFTLSIDMTDKQPQKDAADAAAPPADEAAAAVAAAAAASTPAVEGDDLFEEFELPGGVCFGCPLFFERGECSLFFLSSRASLRGSAGPRPSPHESGGAFTGMLAVGAGDEALLSSPRHRKIKRRHAAQTCEKNRHNAPSSRSCFHARRPPRSRPYPHTRTPTHRKQARPRTRPKWRPTMRTYRCGRRSGRTRTRATSWAGSRRSWPRGGSVRRRLWGARGRAEGWTGRWEGIPL